VKKHGSAVRHLDHRSSRCTSCAPAVDAFSAHICPTGHHAQSLVRFPDSPSANRSIIFAKQYDPHPRTSRQEPSASCYPGTARCQISHVSSRFISTWTGTG
jgi:hypothetical protein